MIYGTDIGTVELVNRPTKNTKIYFMKKPLLTTLGLALLSGSLFIASCDKSDNNPTPPPSGGNSRVAAVHASPLTGPASFTLGNVTLTTNPLTIGQSSGSAGNPYVSVTSGTPTIQVSANGSNVVDGTTTISTDSAYTIFAYDTVGSGGAGKVRAIQLNDNLATPASGFANVRFIHLSPDAPAVKIQLMSATDSITLVDSAAFIGQPSDVTTLSQFTSVPSGDYHVTVKVPSLGDSTVVDIPTLSLTDQKIYTVYAMGLNRFNVAGSPNDPNALRVGVLQHN